MGGIYGLSTRHLTAGLDILRHLTCWHMHPHHWGHHMRRRYSIRELHHRSSEMRMFHLHFRMVMITHVRMGWEIHVGGPHWVHNIRIRNAMLHRHHAWMLSLTRWLPKGRLQLPRVTYIRGRLILHPRSQKFGRGRSERFWIPKLYISDSLEWRRMLDFYCTRNLSNHQIYSI
jgi:hypothetical protein